MPGGAGEIPFEREPINYLTAPVHDPVALLQAKLQAGKVALGHDERQGYLSSVLQQLKVPISSQVLVFSKTSFQRTRIAPESPRAIYFNDDPGSDIVALMVLEHQVKMHNLITLANYQARIAIHYSMAINKALGEPENTISESTARRFEGPAEDLVKYMLFVDEAEFNDPVQGTTTFAREFSARGPRDRQGRSLRDLDLKTRLLQYPCSYLIYSKAFDALPAPAKDRVYRRLWDVLTGHDQSPAFARRTSAQRQAILEILRATKPGLPDYWKTSR